MFLKTLLLNQANATYTYFDSGYIADKGSYDKLEFFEAKLLNESELIKGEAERLLEPGSSEAIEAGLLSFTEIQIKTKINTSEIKEIVLFDREPLQEEREVAANLGIPIRVGGMLLALIQEQQDSEISTETEIQTPVIVSPLIEPAVLPNFPNFPMSNLPRIPPLESTDIVPFGRLANFKEFKSIEDAGQWLLSGKDLEIDFSFEKCPIKLQGDAIEGGSSIWHKGIKYN